MLKIGIVGCGGISGMHIPSYEALGYDICAVADLVDEKTEKLREKYNCAVYKTGEDLINNADVDTVSICLPTYLHTHHAVLAMNKGMNVFIEKPLCLTEDEIGILLETQKKTGAKVQVGHVVRFFPSYNWLKEKNDTGEYGKLISATFNRISPGPGWSWENLFNDPEKSGSVALDLHIHDLDYVRYLMGDPDYIYAEATRNNKGVLSQIFTTYKYGQTIIKIEGDWNNPSTFKFDSSFRVKFENATITYNGDSLSVYHADGRVENPIFKQSVDKKIDSAINISDLGAYYDEIKYFTDALESGNEIKMNTLESAAGSVRLALQGIKIAGGTVNKNN